MNTHTRILITTLPLVFMLVFILIGITGYISAKALDDLGETWLSAMLSKAVAVVEQQDSNLQRYNLHQIPASLRKAKIDAASEMSAIEVGKQGYIFAVDSKGVITVHPDESRKGTDISSEPWFGKLSPEGGNITYGAGKREHLAVFEYFEPWDWYVLASDPRQDFYGAATRLTPVMILIGFAGMAVVAAALILLTRRLLRPLESLTGGAEEIGSGNLDSRIHVYQNDEFGRLAKVFNHMAERLQETLTTIRHKEEYFRSLIENASDIIIILDREGTVLYLSPSSERLLEYTEQDLKGFNCLDLIHPEDKPGATALFKKRTRTQGVNPAVEFRVRHKNGSYRTVESISQNLLDHPAVQGFVINARDITLRKEMEKELQKSYQKLEKRVEERTADLKKSNRALRGEIITRKEKERELEDANKAKSELLANISHEIRTPLNSIIGFSELLMTMTRDTEMINYLETIRTAGRTLMNSINDILDLSKIEAGMLEISCVSVNLDAIFREIRQIFTIKAKKKSIRLDQSIDTDIPSHLLLDDMRLRQVLMNLVGNAVKFTENGEVRITARAVDKDHQNGMLDLEIRVEDTGIGIPEEKTELIFRDFHQESSGTTRLFGGTGLGLSISRRLVRLMGGEISVQSTPGAGSSFVVLLTGVNISSHKPIGDDIDYISREKIIFSKESVLVADYESVTRLMIKKHLEKANLKVIEAENAEQSILLAGEKRPDLVLMDGDMPDMNGKDAVKMIRQDPALSDIPVLLMTTDSTDETNEVSYTGTLPDGYIEKPIHTEALFREIIKNLSGYKLEDSPAVPENDGLRDFFEKHGTVPRKLGEKLETDILPEIEGLENGMTFSTVKRIAGNLKSLGEKFQYPPLSVYGNELYLMVEAFDIEGINRHAKEITEIIRQY